MKMPITNDALIAAADRVQKLYKGVTYKKGTDIFVAAARDSVVVHVKLEVDDVHNSGRSHRVHPKYSGGVYEWSMDYGMKRHPASNFSQPFYISAMFPIAEIEAAILSDDLLLMMLYQHIVMMETHEVQEWFKHDGKTFVDPHPPTPMPLAMMPALLPKEKEEPNG